MNGPEHEQDPDRADEREDTYWPSGAASIEELIDAAFADAHVTAEHDIPPEEHAAVLAPIAARIEDLAARLEHLVRGEVDLNPSMGTVASRLSDVEKLAAALRAVIASEDVETTAAELRYIHHAAWDEYELLRPLSDRIPGPTVSPLVQRIMDVHVAAQQCIIALGEPLDPA